MPPNKNQNLTNQEKKSIGKKIDKWSDSNLFMIVILAFILTLNLPWILVSGSIIDFTESGQIGDTIGGITAPFIGLISAFLVYKAFRQQKIANDKQVEILEAQQHDREFNIYFKLIEDLLRIEMSFERKNEYGFVTKLGYQLLQVSAEPEKQFANKVVQFESFIDQFSFVIDFIKKSRCTKRDKVFFEKKLLLDFESSITGLSLIFYEKWRLEEEGVYDDIKDIFDKLKLIVNFKEQVIRNE